VRLRANPGLFGLLALTLVATAACGGGTPQGHHAASAKAPSFELALVRGGDLYLVTRSGGTPRRLTHGLQASYPLFSPDGRYIAFVDATGQGSPDELGTVGIDGHGLTLFGGLLPASQGAFAWNPKQDVLAVWGAGLWTAVPGGKPQALAEISGRVDSFAWAPDGTGYAYTVLPPYTAPPLPSDVLYVARDGDAPSVRLRAQNGNGLLLAGYWPNGQGLLYWEDPLHSASLAADGLSLLSLSLANGGPRTLATTLPYPSWVQPLGSQSVITVAGQGRTAWTEKSLVACALAQATCGAIEAQGGAVALDPAGSAGSRSIAWITAKDLSPMSPGTPSVLAAWNAGRALYAATLGRGAQPKVKVASGDVFDPAWNAAGTELLYVQGGWVKLFRWGRGSVRLARISSAKAPPQGYYGFASWSSTFAWYPGAPASAK